MCCALSNQAWSQTEDSSEADDESIDSYWNRIYDDEDVIDAVDLDNDSDSTDETEAAQDEEAGQSDFFDHLFVRTGVDLTLNFADYSGEPSRTYVVDDGPELTITPDGFSYPGAFDEHDSRFDAYLVAGTRGYQDSRLNTYFSALYQNSGVVSGSVFQNFADAFSDGNRTEIVNAYAELNEIGDGGYLKNTSIRIGRQYMFDTSPHLLGSPLVDGIMARYNSEQMQFDVFTGRRVNLFSTPNTDVAYGTSVDYKLTGDIWGGFNYVRVRDEHRYAVEIRRSTEQWQSRGYLTFRDVDPAELGVDVWYSVVAVPLQLRGSVIRRLSSQDYVYDIFLARDELEQRLRLGEQQESTSFRVDADYELYPWVTVGGTFEAQRFDGNIESAFDNPFTELSARASLTPWDNWDLLVQYAHRDIDRSGLDDVIAARLFDDTTHAGETLYKEFSADIYYRWNERTSFNAGGYFTRVEGRTRLAVITDSEANGLYFRGQSRVRKWLDFKFEYSWDKPNPDFYPDIESQSSLRLGVEFRHN